MALQGRSPSPVAPPSATLRYSSSASRGPQQPGGDWGVGETIL